VLRSVEDAWRITTDGGTVPLHSRMALRLAATHAGQTARRTVASLYDLAGSTAIYDSSSLQRRFRDAHTASAHVQLNADSWELSGGVLLGVDTPTELV
jgi:indole-3-acetate monooxygenase